MSVEPILDDGPRWRLVFGLLSLDSVLGLLDVLGLRLVDAAHVQAVARRFVRDYAALDRGVGLGPDERAARRARLIAGALDAIADPSPADRRALLDWVLHSFVYDSHRAEASAVKRLVLRRLSRAGGTEGQSSMSAASRALVDGAVDVFMTSAAELRARLDEARNGDQTPSGRDLDELFDGGTAMDWVEDTAESVAAGIVWSGLLESLSPADREELLTVARREARRRGLSGDVSSW